MKIVSNFPSSSSSSQSCLLLLLMLFTVPTTAVTEQDGDPSVLQRLITYLQKRNPSKAIPMLNHSNNITVLLSIAPHRLYLDDKLQEMTLEAWTFLGWRDAFLTWSPIEYAGLDRVNLDAGDLWLPDLALYNRALNTEHNRLFEKVPIIVKFTGDVMWFPPTFAKVPCPIDLHFWPSDKHNCSFEFGSWSHHGEQIDLQIAQINGGIMMDNYQDSNGWKLTESSSARRQMFAAGFQHVDLEFSFEVQRMAGDHVTYLQTSCIVVMVCIFVSYTLSAKPILPRLSIHLFCLALLFACHITLYMSLPNTTGKTPFILHSYLGCIMLTALSLGSTVLLHRLTKITTPGLGLMQVIKKTSQDVARYTHLDESHVEISVNGPHGNSSLGGGGNPQRSQPSQSAEVTITNIGATTTNENFTSNDNYFSRSGESVAPVHEHSSANNTNTPNTQNGSSLTDNDTCTGSSGGRNTLDYMELMMERQKYAMNVRVKAANVLCAAFYIGALFINFIVLSVVINS